MGCDYYIDIYLKIEHTGGMCYIELPCIRGYFCDCAWGVYEKNEDEEPYWHCEEAQNLRKQMEEFMLKPRPELIIYSNKQYKSEFLQEKYEPLIVQKLEEKKCEKIRYDDTAKLQNLDNIITITKFEVRYEPSC